LKEKHGYNCCLIERTSIMFLFRKAWTRSFARVESKTRAIQQRGFFPLTCNLIGRVELQTEGREDVSQALGDAHFRAFNDGHDRIHPTTLNLEEGYAGDCIRMIVAHENRKQDKDGIDPAMVAEEKGSLALKQIKD
jgi:hypothetical protein